jgi:2-oxoacid:acceptor oxidoreductase gamma subunit (pyruvate/2-ketoisovalerate family)
MREIRFHGKGGQGVVKSAQIIVQSVVDKGSYAHFIPSFGVERKGSPVHGFLRLDNKNIKLKSQVYKPEAVVVFDDTLIKLPATLSGLQAGSTLIINSGKSLEELKLPAEADQVYVVDATTIALDTIKVDIPNTVMLGAYAKVIGDVDWPTLQQNIIKAFGQVNYEAAIKGYDSVKRIK